MARPLLIDFNNLPPMRGRIFSNLLDGRIPFKRLAAFAATLTVVFVSACEMKVFAATPEFRWSASVAPGYFYAGTNTTYLAVDSTGNSYLFIRFFGATTYGSDVFVSRGGYDILIAKYDRSGSLSWAKRFGGDRDEDGVAVTVDTSGNCYLIGSSSGSTNADFGQLTLTNADHSNYLFIAKIDPNGNTIWLNKAGGHFGPLPRGAATDRLGNCYVTGTLGQQTSNFGSIALTNATPNSAFLAKYDSRGGLVWVKSASSLSFGDRVIVDNGGNVFWLGEYGSTMSLDGVVLSSKTYLNWFWAQLDDDGSLVLLKRIGGGSSPGVLQANVTLGAMDQVYFVGTFGVSANRTNVDFGGLALTSRGNYDAFVAKCDKAGNAFWVKTLGGQGADYGHGLAVDAEDNCYVVGSFSSSVSEFGGATLASRGGYDVFIAKFDPLGKLIWAKQAGGTRNDAGLDIGLDSSGNCYVMGFYSDPASFDMISLTNSSSCFLARINTGPPPLTITRSAEQGLIFWPANKLGFALESSTSLSTNASWSSVTNPSAVVGDQRVVIYDISVGDRFYRLRD